MNWAGEDFLLLALFAVPLICGVVACIALFRSGHVRDEHEDYDRRAG